MKKIVNTVSAGFRIGLAFLADAHEAKIVLYPTIGPVSIPLMLVSKVVCSSR